jgi:hypothetical protein
MGTIFTHERVDLATGLLAVPTLLWGGNALQSIQITRNTPRNPQQAIGYLGVVDYTRGIVTSDVSLDTFLVEHNTDATLLASAASAINKYAAQTITAGTESYALTSFALACAAGAPTTANYGWMTAGLASYLKTKAAPAVSDGNVFAMVLGDEGSGLSLVAEWGDMDEETDGNQTPSTSTIPVIHDDGTSGTVGDSGLPAGVQSVNIQGNINRDNVLDVRSSLPCAFITTYPVGITMDMEVYQLPGTTDPSTTPPAWNFLKSLSIVSAADATKIYAKITGLAKQSETEAIGVGRYLSYNVNFQGSEIWMPLKSLS